MEHLSISDYIVSHRKSIRDKRIKAIAKHRRHTRAAMAILIASIAPEHTDEDIEGGMMMSGPMEYAIEMTGDTLRYKRAKLKMWEQQTVKHNLGYDPLTNTGLEQARQDYYTWLENLLIVRRVVGYIREEEITRFGKSVEIKMDQGR